VLNVPLNASGLGLKNKLSHCVQIFRENSSEKEIVKAIKASFTKNQINRMNSDKIALKDIVLRKSLEPPLTGPKIINFPCFRQLFA